MKNDNFKNLKILIDIVTKLRDPDEGCPWDKKQTLTSIAPHTIEEAYELAEALQDNNIENIIDELGDLLFHILFYCHIGKENNNFDLEAIAKNASQKMISRHPHVFNNKKYHKTSFEKNWEKNKILSNKINYNSILDGIAKNLPPIKKSLKLQKRASVFGFDWKDVELIFNKLDEEINELNIEIKNKNKKNIEEEIGDILFTVINLARKLEVDPEIAIINCNKKFIKRFNYIEKKFNEKNISLSNEKLKLMEKLWEDSKIK